MIDLQEHAQAMRMVLETASEQERKPQVAFVGATVEVRLLSRATNECMFRVDCMWHVDNEHKSSIGLGMHTLRSA